MEQQLCSKRSKSRVNPCPPNHLCFPWHSSYCMKRTYWCFGLKETQTPLSLSHDWVHCADEKLDSTKDVGTMNSPAASRRDAATQMSPEGSTCSSPRERPSFSPPSSNLPMTELENHHSSKLEIKDVEVDDCVTVTRWSKKHGSRGLNKGSTKIRSWRKKAVETQASAWEVAETTKSISK